MQSSEKIKKITLGLPKGSLQNATFQMFEKAGYNITLGERSYYPIIDDEEIECILIRAQEMGRYVDKGILDAGFTGRDWIVETNARVHTVSELIYSKTGMKPVKWVLAVPENSKIKSINDLQGKIISTEAVNITKNYLKKNNIKAEVEFSWGATEVKPPRFADAIVEVTETGSSLKANKLKIIDTLMESTTVFIANREIYNKDQWKKKKIERISLMLQAVIIAQSKVGLLLNVKRRNLKDILNVLPSLESPTVSELSDTEWVAINTIIDESEVRKLIPKLKEQGATGIVEYPINKLIP